MRRVRRRTPKRQPGLVRAARGSIRKMSEERGPTAAAVRDLAHRLHALRLAAADTANNWLLDSMSDSSLSGLPENDWTRCKTQALCSQVKDLQLQHSDGWEAFFTLYGELEVYGLLHAGGLEPEGLAASSDPGPDMRVRSPSDHVYLEVKTPLPSAQGDRPGETRLGEYQQRSLDGKAAMEERLASGRSHAFAENWFSPLLGTTQADWIKKVRQKLRQNFKSGQYRRGPTVMAVNARGMGCYGSVRRAAAAIHMNGGDPESGSLWTCFLAKETDSVFEAPEFEGQPWRKCAVPMPGMLLSSDYDCVAGVLWCDGGLAGARLSRERSVMFVRDGACDAEQNTMAALAKAASWRNDQFNRFAFELLGSDEHSGAVSPG